MIRILWNVLILHILEPQAQSSLKNSASFAETVCFVHWRYHTVIGNVTVLFELEYIIKVLDFADFSGINFIESIGVHRCGRSKRRLLKRNLYTGYSTMLHASCLIMLWWSKRTVNYLLIFSFLLHVAVCRRLLQAYDRTRYRDFTTDECTDRE